MLNNAAMLSHTTNFIAAAALLVYGWYCATGPVLPCTSGLDGEYASVLACTSGLDGEYASPLACTSGLDGEYSPAPRSSTMPAAVLQTALGECMGRQPAPAKAGVREAAL